jgi:hypothetical protein
MPELGNFDIRHPIPRGDAENTIKINALDLHLRVI